MAFLPINRPKRSAVEEPMVHIVTTPDGATARLNIHACRDMGTERGERISLVILWDDETNRMGFLVSQDRDHAAYARNHAVTPLGVRTSIRRFCDDHDIDPLTIKGDHPVCVDEATGIHYINLKWARTAAGFRNRLRAVRNGEAASA
jgi:hypothetical protein